MVTEEYIKKVFNKLTDNKKRNVKIINKYFKKDQLNKVLWYFCDNIDKSMYTNLSDILKLNIIEALLESGADPNYSHKGHITNIIHLLLHRYTSEELFYNILDLSMKFNIDFSKINEEYNYFCYRLLEKPTPISYVTPVFKKFVENGYDIFLTDYKYRRLDDKSVRFHYKMKDKEEFIEEYRKLKKEKFETRKNEIINEIITKYPNLDYEDKEGNTLLHILVESCYDEDILLEVIYYLIENGIDVNAKNNYGNTFIYSLIRIPQRSESFIYKILDKALTYMYDPDVLDHEGDSILYNLIYYRKNINIIPFYHKLVSNGFNVNIKNRNGETIFEYILENDNIKDKTKFIKKYFKDFEAGNQFYNDLIRLMSIGKIVNFDNNIIKKYKVMATEVEQNSCCIDLIVSKEGGGKTKTIHYLANYLINEKNSLVYLVNAKDIIEKSNSISGLRELFLEIMNICERNNITLCIDDLDKLYNLNASNYYKEELNILIYHYIFSKNLYLIATMDINKKDKIIDETLENNVELYNLEETNNNNLKYIIEFSLFDLRNDNEINASNLILNIMKEILFTILDNDYNIINYDKVSKVKIIDNIVNDMYQSYKLNNINNLEINDLIYAIKLNKYIKEETKDIVIKELNNLNNNLSKDNIKKLIKQIIRR